MLAEMGLLDLKAFYCAAYVHERNKLKYILSKHISLDYRKQKKTYIVWCHTARRVVMRKHASSIENALLKVKSPSTNENLRIRGQYQR